MFDFEKLVELHDEKGNMMAKVCQNIGCGPCSNPILLDPDINNDRQFCANCLIKDLVSEGLDMPRGFDVDRLYLRINSCIK